MKIKIKPYLWSLLKENKLYLAALILLLGLFFFILTVNFPQLVKTKEEINSLTQEVNNLKKRLDLVNSLAVKSTELEENINFINRLIPGEEDYFSIIYALEQLSSKTGFLITSYNIDLKNSNTNKLKLNITGIGDRSTFMKFLQEYNFGGGRLITADKIELDQQLTGGIKINLTFYNKKVVQDQTIIENNVKKHLSEINDLKNKVQFTFKEATAEADFDYDYPRKTNPF